MQRLTLEIILRAVFGLDPGERLDALRERLAKLAAYGDKPITLLGPPPEWLEPCAQPRRAAAPASSTCARRSTRCSSS